MDAVKELHYEHRQTQIELKVHRRQSISDEKNFDNTKTVSFDRLLAVDY